MPKQNSTTTTFKADISDLKKGLQDAGRQIRLANAEFKAASSGMEDWENSADGVSEKITQLNKVLSAEEEKLKLLKEQHRLVAEEQGENSKGAQELAIKIANQQAAVNKTEKELNKYNEKLSDLTNESAEAGKESVALAKDLDKVETTAEDVQKSVEGLAASFKGGLVNGFKAVAAAAAGAVTAFLAAGETSQDYREDMGKLEAGFTSAGHSAETAKKAYEAMVGILGETDQSVEAVNHLARLTKSEEELAKWTDIAAGVYGTFGDSLPLEGLTEAANETAKVAKVTGPLADALNWAGVSEDEFNKKLEATNTEAERATLITDTLNGLYAEASEVYQDVNKDLIEARKAQSGLNDAMAEVGKKSMPILTEIKQGFTDVLLAALDMSKGIDFESMAAGIEKGFAYFIENVMPEIKNGFLWIKDNMPQIIASIGALGAAFAVIKIGSLVAGIAKFIGVVKGASTVLAGLKLALAAIGGPVTLVIAGIAALVTAFMTLWKNSEEFRNFWFELWDSIKNIVALAIEWFKGVWESIKLFFTVTIPTEFNKFLVTVGNFITSIKTWFSQLPTHIYNVIVNILGHLLAWGIQLYIFATTKIPEFIDTVILFFSQLPGRIWTWLVNAYANIKQWGKDTINEGIRTGREFLNKVVEFISQLPAKVWKWLLDTIKKASDFGKKLIETGKKSASDTVTGIIDGFKNLPGQLYDAGVDALEGFWNGLKSVGRRIKSWASDFFGSILAKAEEVLQIASPSKAFKKVGRFVMQGFDEGMDAESKNVLKNTAQTFRNVIDTGKGALSDVSASLARKDSGFYPALATPGGGVVNNYNFNQTNNSPKSLSRLEIYRQTKNLLNFKEA